MSFRRKGTPYYWISYYDPTGRRIRESTKFERKAQADILERSKRNAVAFARGLRRSPESTRPRSREVTRRTQGEVRAATTAAM